MSEPKESFQGESLGDELDLDMAIARLKSMPPGTRISNPRQGSSDEKLVRQKLAEAGVMAKISVEATLDLKPGTYRYVIEVVPTENKHLGREWDADKAIAKLKDMPPCTKISIPIPGRGAKEIIERKITEAGLKASLTIEPTLDLKPDTLLCIIEILP